MFLYLSLLLISPISLILFRKSEKKEKIALSATCVAVFLLLALRSKDSGCDLTAYASMYETLKDVSFVEVLKSFVFFGKSPLVGVEWGYTLFTWFFSKIGLGFQLLLVVQSAFCVFSIWHFIDKYSVKPSLSIVIIIAFGIVDYSYCILRQAMAFAIILFAVEFLEKKKYHFFILLFLVAILFHKSVVLFGVLLPLSFVPINWYTSIGWIVLSTLILPLFPFFNELFIEKFMLKFGRSYISTGFEFGELIIVILAIALFVTFFYTRKETITNLDKLVFWSFMVCVPLEFLAMYMPILGRLLTLCFMPFASVAITNSFISEERGEDKLTCTFEVLIYLAVFAYYAYCLYFDSRLLEIVPYKLFFMK